MKGNSLILGLLFLFLMGCATAMGTFPHGTGTQVDLSRANYRIVKANAIGTSSGFRLLGIIPLASPRYTTAMSELYSKAGMSEGKSHALVNVIQERSSLYLILFSIPKLTIRADIIEFFDESGKK
jgi:hypothetical protein